VRGGDELVAIVSDTDIGKKLHVEYMREGKRASADVEVADRNKIIGENLVSGPAEGNPDASPAAGGILGLGVKNLTADQGQELATQLHLESRQGVLVLEVQASGFASDLGVEHGDVILSINRHPVTSVDDYNKLQGQLKSGGDVVLLVARRNGPRGFTTLFLADRLP
jgi:S1-C subfamily serine protease